MFTNINCDEFRATFHQVIYSHSHTDSFIRPERPGTKAFVVGGRTRSAQGKSFFNPPPNVLSSLSTNRLELIVQFRWLLLGFIVLTYFRNQLTSIFVILIVFGNVTTLCKKLVSCRVVYFIIVGLNIFFYLTDFFYFSYL